MYRREGHREIAAYRLRAASWRIGFSYEIPGVTFSCYALSARMAPTSALEIGDLFLSPSAGVM